MTCKYAVEERGGFQLRHRSTLLPGKQKDMIVTIVRIYSSLLINFDKTIMTNLIY